MKKFDEFRDILREKCSPGKKQRVIKMLNELYNVTRDFSQIIKIENKDGSFKVTHDSINGTAEYAMKCKKRMQEWVGGH